MNSPICTKSTQIERETCSRCGGTGRMPFAVYGGVCFKCGGNGYVLTKRGAEANRYLIELRSRPAKDLKVGDCIRVDFMPSPGAFVKAFADITSIVLITEENATAWTTSGGVRTALGLGQLLIEVESPRYGRSSNYYPLEQLVRTAQTSEQKTETLAKALAYQDTLTKQGKVRK